MRTHTMLWLMLAALWGAAPAFAQTSITAWTCDMGTARLSAGADALHSAGGQGQPVPALRSGSTVLYQGFLGGAVLRSDLDTDGDGIADETDPDNDGDGLMDLSELSGEDFEPDTSTGVNDADSDDDGATDGEELAMLSNPQNQDSLLEFTMLGVQGNDMTLRWKARASQEYQLEWGSALGSESPTNTLGSPVTAAAGGLGPWYEVEATGTVARPSSGAVILRVRRTP